MTDHVTVFPPGWRLTDANDNPISGGTVEFYSPGTTTPLTVYSDKDLSTPIGTSVTTDSSGYPASGGNKCIVYTTTAALKLILKDDAGVQIATHDQWQPVGITGSGGSSSTVDHVLSKSTDFTVQSTQSGYVFNCDPTGASFQCTLLSAITAGDGFRITLRHNGTANQLKIATSLGQTLQVPGGSTTSGYSLTGKGHSVSLVSDGAGWIVRHETPPLVSGRISVFSVVTRVTAAPTSPTPGARYLINGTPTGVLSTLGIADKDVIEADGQGGWIKYTPPTDCGWLAYNQADGYFYQYKTTTWTAWSNVAAPSSRSLRRMIVRDERTSGTSAPAATTGSWVTRTLQTTSVNTITTANGASADASLASNTVTLPTGDYLIIARMPVIYNNSSSGASRGRIRNTTTSTSFYGDSEQSWVNTATTATTAQNLVVATISIAAATENLVFETYSTGSATTNGISMSLSSITEDFASVVIIDLSAQQGAQGVAGSTGPAGPGYSATSTTSITLGTGSTTWTTQSGLAYVAGQRVRVANDSTHYAEGPITSYTGSSLVVNVDRIVGTGTFASWNIGIAGDQGAAGSNGSNGTNGSAATIAVGTTTTGAAGSSASVTNSGSSSAATFNFTIPRGDTGATGATGPNTGLDFAFNTATSGDPGSGKFLYNNATLASVTAINISKTGRNGESLGSLIATWDDSTNTAHYGHIRAFTVADRTKYGEFELTGLTDNTTYYTLTVTRTASGTLHANTDVCAVMFERTGNKGADGAGIGDVVGPASSVDSELALFSSTTGKLIKRAAMTGLVKAASGVASAATAGTDYLAPPSGTAILKANSGGALANATAGTDYLAPPSGTALLKANSGGALANAVAGTDYLAPPSGTAILKANSGGALANATAGTDYLAPPSGTSVLKANSGGALANAAATDLGAGKHTIYIPAAAMTARTTNGAATGTVETTTNKIMFSTLDYDATTQQFAQFSIRMPKSWDESTVTATFAWSHASTTTNFGVAWAIEAVAISDLDAGDAAFGTAQQVTDTGGTTNTLYVTSATSAMTVAGTPQPEDWVVFQVKRVPADAADTMAINARLHGVTLYFNTDAITDA